MVSRRRLRDWVDRNGWQPGAEETGYHHRFQGYGFAGNDQTLPRSDHADQVASRGVTLGPLSVPDEYFADCFRGCIDGDGTILVYTDRYHIAKNERYVYERLYVSIVSASRTFITSTLIPSGNFATRKRNPYGS